MFEPRLDVIGVEHGVTRRLGQPVAAMAQHKGQSAHEHAHLAVEGRQAPKTLAGTHRFLEAEIAAFRRQEGHGRIRRQRFAENDRTGARSATAMRGREGLVQVEMHGVDAKIARPDKTHDGVEIGAVAVKVTPRPRCTAAAISTISGSNRPAVLGLVSMIAATSGPSAFLTASQHQPCPCLRPARPGPCSQGRPPLPDWCRVPPRAPAPHRDGLHL